MNAPRRIDVILLDLQLNETFTALFFLEMLIKLGLLGPHAYMRDGYNVFDFVVTWLGLIEITVQVGQSRLYRDTILVNTIEIYEFRQIFCTSSIGR